jgi:hypothetical protein
MAEGAQVEESAEAAAVRGTVKIGAAAVVDNARVPTANAIVGGIMMMSD